MTNNKRPENMIRITNEELAKAFIDEQIKAIKEQVKDKKSFTCPIRWSRFISCRSVINQSNW